MSQFSLTEEAHYLLALKNNRYKDSIRVQTNYVNSHFFSCLPLYRLKMHRNRNNIVLIGMPGSGKSTIGVILAKKLAKSFLDSDILIQNQEKRILQDIVDHEGHMVLRAVEESVLLGITCSDHVIATGGSAAYSDPAMNHLKKQGVIVYLHADLSVLQTRVGNYETRGLAKRPDQSFQDLFNERLTLYKKYADITIDSSKLTQEQVCDIIFEWLRKTHKSDNN